MPSTRGVLRPMRSGDSESWHSPQVERLGAPREHVLGGDPGLGRGQDAATAANYRMHRSLHRSPGEVDEADNETGTDLANAQDRESPLRKTRTMANRTTVVGRRGRFWEGLSGSGSGSGSVSGFGFMGLGALARSRPRERFRKMRDLSGAATGPGARRSSITASRQHDDGVAASGGPGGAGANTHGEIAMHFPQYACVSRLLLGLDRLDVDPLGWAGIQRVCRQHLIQ